MKRVFVKDIGGGEAPVVIAVYNMDTDVPADAHPGTSMLEVPDTAIIADVNPHSMIVTGMRLTKDWRARSATASASARQQLGSMLTTESRIGALHEVVDLILQHGTDMAQWPPQARERKAHLDQVSGTPESK